MPTARPVTTGPAVVDTDDRAAERRARVPVVGCQPACLGVAGNV